MTLESGSGNFLAGNGTFDLLWNWNRNWNQIFPEPSIIGACVKFKQDEIASPGHQADETLAGKWCNII